VTFTDPMRASPPVTGVVVVSLVAKLKPVALTDETTTLRPLKAGEEVPSRVTDWPTLKGGSVGVTTVAATPLAVRELRATWGLLSLSEVMGTWVAPVVANVNPVGEVDVTVTVMPLTAVRAAS
jgi:hypothetical protein